MVGCGATQDAAIVRQRVNAVNSWHLVYTSRLDPSEPRPLNEISTLQPAQVERNLRLADMVSDILKKDYGIALAQDTSMNSGMIRLTATESLNGYLKYSDIALYDMHNELITGTRIFSDTQAMIQISSDIHTTLNTFNQSYASFIAEKTAKILGAHHREMR